MTVCRRRVAAMVCAGLVMATGMPADAVERDESAPGNISSSPATEAEGSGKSFSGLQPNNPVEWVGMFGFLLLLLRGACRR